MSKGEVVFCHHYGMGVLGTGVIQDCFPSLLCQSADVDAVAVEGFSVVWLAVFIFFSFGVFSFLVSLFLWCPRVGSTSFFVGRRRRRVGWWLGRWGR